MSNPKEKITPEKLAKMKQELSYIGAQIIKEMEEEHEKAKREVSSAETARCI